MIIQTSCSELLVDTAIHDPNQALKDFKHLFKEYGFESSPPLSVKVLKEIKEDSEKKGDDRSYDSISVFDNDGHSAALEYGNNGYIDCGFRIDTGCNDYDENAFPILNAFEEYLEGEPIVCDGGHMDGYDEWKQKYAEDKLPNEQKAFRRIQK